MYQKLCIFSLNIIVNYIRVLLLQCLHYYINGRVNEIARKVGIHVIMAAAVVDILSDDHLERFYREHVAGKTSLDEDIRAIEEEIDK